MTKLMELSASLGAQKFQFKVFEGNDSAVKFHEKMGFHLEGTFKSEVLINGEFRDAYMMAKFV